ncbi:hypothetical protein HAX54_002088 [Datura stramonium]|uniref:Protein kinase domain-containing protein n=1 Tax=Datura stramonium TaxID=4076 RepID=A0ABS8WR21_DATST|nr:hypothetical protein [Datura stramonium]
MDYNSGSRTEEFEIPLFDLSTITKATNNFSVNRKIGEGGFGPVYKIKRYLVRPNETCRITKGRRVGIEGNGLLVHELISDFGIARCYEEDENVAMTNRVIGTYGYLSPEYALYGLYSIKSDVLSFSILVLEIVRGKSNRRFSPSDLNLSLIGHAWELYKEGRSIELLDERLGDSCSTPQEVVRSICVGLLCIQQCLDDRPSMSSVVLMLNNEGPLPQAKQPAFYIEGDASDTEFFSNQFAHTSMDDTPLEYR